ncbi:MAG: protein-export chaperone SecB [Gammaproteobacteria bacterium]|nr:protein-export chaperone SecB [Gammaproteobacteria bacterium]
MAWQPDTQQQFEIQKIYLKDVSFEAPNSPSIFTEPWKPETSVQLSTERARLDEGLHELVLGITVTAKMADKTAYLVEVKQAGIFALKGFAEPQMRQLLGSYCPNVLFPFAREAIAELITKGGFPPMLLAPINFDALNAQQQRQRETETETGPTH